jgi:threonine dehydratase
MERRGLGAPTRIITPCGGGGLTAGLALALPDAEIVPVEPEGWDDMRLSLAAGEIVPVADPSFPTACDALQTPSTRPINFEVIKGRVPFGLMVTPAEVRAAQRFAFRELRLVVEPGGAAALAAALAGKVALDGRTAIVLSGGNTDTAAFAKVLSTSD